MNLHRRLEAGGGGENLAFFHRQGGVAVDEFGKYVAHRLHAQTHGGYVQQHQAFHVAGHNAPLNGRAHGHAFVGVHALEGLLAQKALYRLLHGGNPGRAAHHQYLGNLRRRQSGILQRLLQGAHGGIHQIPGHFVEFRPGQGDFHVLGAGSVHGEEGQVHRGGHQPRKLDLGLFSRFPHPLHGHRVSRQVDAGGSPEVVHQIIRDALVEIVAAQVIVPRRGQHFHHVRGNVQNGNVEGAAAQVVYHDLLGGFLVDAVGQGRGGGLVNDALHAQPGDGARVLGGLTLSVGEVGRHGDHRVGDSFAQERLRVGLQLLQDHGADFLGRVGFAVDLHPVIGAHLPLDGADGAGRIGDGLAFGHLAHHALAIFGKGHDGRRGAAAVGRDDDRGLSALDICYARIGSAQVDADGFRHGFLPPGWIGSPWELVSLYTHCVNRI